MSDAYQIRVGASVILAGGAAPAFATAFALNASTDAVEWVCHPTEAATLTRIGVRLGAITGTTPTYRVSLQGVGTTGNPDGTIKGATNNALKTFSPSGLGWGAGSWNWLTLDESYTCARGEDLAVVIDYSSGTVDGSNFASFTTSIGTCSASAHPYAIHNDAGSRTRQGNVIPCFGYGSAGKAFGNPLETITTAAFGSTSTPDEYAMMFTLPSGWGSTFKVAGVRIAAGLNAGKTVTFTLYDSDGTTALQTVTHDTDYVVSTGIRYIDIYFDEVTLSDLNFGAAYRVSMTASDATTHSIVTLDMDAAADWDAWPGAQVFALSTRTDAGAWTNDATRRPIMELILADWTEPTGGGGGLLRPVPMSGGLT